MSGVKGKSGIYNRTEKAKENMSKAHLGQKSWCKGIKMIEHNPNYINPKGMLGKKMSEETKAKIREATSGEKSHLWKGGISKDKNKYHRERYRNLSDDNKKIVSWNRNKRNRLKGATIKELGTHTYEEWELLKKQYNHTCPCCGLSEPFDQKSQYLTEDHIIPLSKGGSDLIENIQPLCLNCNIKKHTLIIKY